jgi:hypothetical protein
MTPRELMTSIIRQYPNKSEEFHSAKFVQEMLKPENTALREEGLRELADVFFAELDYDEEDDEA